MSRLYSKERFTSYNCEYRWVAPDAVLRGYWFSTDGTGIKVFPPSEGCTDWHVRVPNSKGEKEELCSDQDAAFSYAASVHRLRAN